MKSVSEKKSSRRDRYCSYTFVILHMRVRSWNNLDAVEKRMIICRNPGIQSKIAREMGVATATVSLVWWGKATSARILAAILQKGRR